MFIKQNNKYKIKYKIYTKKKKNKTNLLSFPYHLKNYY